MLLTLYRSSKSCRIKIMKLHSIPDDPEITGLTHRLSSANDVVHMGVYRVMYGWRVRAGRCSDLWGTRLDWCGGGNWKDVERLYSLLYGILSQREESEDCLDDLPECSKIKPFYNDHEFVRLVGELAGDFELLELEKPCLF